MGICVYCGAMLGVDDRFCGHCGKPVHKSFNSCDFSSAEKRERGRKGILLTDSVRLSEQLNVARPVILSCIHNYIKQVSSYISYSFLDVSGESASDWRSCHKLLYKNHFLNVHGELGYLFIVGGDEVIPVPSMRNCMPKDYKKFVPTDILYGYEISLYNSDAEDINTLFKSKPAYYVGRLPLATDATFDILQSYLERAVGYMKNGVPVQMAYAQSDPHWKHVSMKVVSELDDMGILPEIKAPESVLHEKVFLTPYITCDTIDNAFNSYGNLYYFNMHGSNNLNTPQFLGQGLEEDESFYAGIDPQTLQTAKFENVVVTEACYGGKFIGLKTDQSMLLSSLSSSTMLYLGSSVIAYGLTDKSIGKEEGVDSADIMAKEFISGLIQGYSAGESVQKARHKLIKIAKSRNSISNLLTVYEFSLYGDPALKVLFPGQKTPPHFEHDMEELMSSPILHVEEVFCETPNSILSAIRTVVDNSLQSLNAEIQRQLTDVGIRPKNLLSISRVQFGLNSQHMFTYQTDNGMEPIVFVDDVSKSKTLLMPKGSIEQAFNDARRLSLNYADIFQSYCRRFGLISVNSEEQPMMEGGDSQTKTVFIDKRIEPKSKRQIKTFNAVLNQVYRPEMRNDNVASLGTKNCEYDFSPLINPLAIVLETELRLSLIPLIVKHGGTKPTEQTFGRMVECFFQNKQVLLKNGISEAFLNLLSEIPIYRNKAAHRGGIDESLFLKFYRIFTQLVSSPVFSKLLDIKQIYR